jgi:hypothetical protein
MAVIKNPRPGVLEKNYINKRKLAKETLFSYTKACWINAESPSLIKAGVTP